MGRLVVKKLMALIIVGALSYLLTGCATSPPLYRAAEQGDIDTVKYLIDKGADVNQRGGGGVLNDSNALSAACSKGDIAIVKLLLERGAIVDAASGNMGWTPLSSAAWQGHTDIVNLLLDRGADINKAIRGLNQGVGTRKAIELLGEIKRERAAHQPVAIASRSTKAISPIVKSDVDEPPSIKAKLNKNAYAIVIGIEEYRQKLPKADFAAADAKIISEYLMKAMGYPEENVVLLTNDKALQSDLAKYFEKWLSNNIEKDSTVFIYYSGHGAPDPKTGGAYLVPYDGDPSFIAETGFSLKRMYDALNKLPAKEIIVALDSCFSGSGGRSVIAKGARPLVMNFRNDIVPAKNMKVLSASSGEQISSTYDEKGHGLFTYFLLKGIKNEDVVNPDGSIRMDDLFGYLKPQVERIARKQYNNEQTPQLTGGN